MSLSPSIKDREYNKFDTNDSGETIVRTSAVGTFTPSGLKTAGKITEVTLNDSTWTALPATALSNRNAIAVQNRSGQEIKINYDNSVGTYTGMVIDNNGERFYDITDAITIYAKSSSGAAVVNVEELS